MNLAFGYDRGVPDTVHTAWGARLIVKQDGYTDLVPDRQDLVAKDDDTKAELIEWLNGGGIGYVREWISDLLRDYTMRTRDSEEFRCDEFVGGGVAVANTNASAGYCYVSVWLDKHVEPSPFEVVGVLSYDPESDTLSPGG